MNQTAPFRLALAFHNHQPVGNFDGVIEQAYRDSYAPFLDVFEPYEDLRISLHISGPLAEWLDLHRPEYLDRVARLVADGRIEILGGPFYEPILAMLPARDRIGQIQLYSRWLADRLGAAVRGMWTPERVWEQSMTRDLADAGMEYTVLDDFHFKNAGLVDAELNGHYITEDDGRLLSIFPGSERLRYTIPFQEPHATIEHLRWCAEQTPGGAATFGDDGEKLGSWPDTHAHVYEHGWLNRFFDALAANRDWLQVCTLGEANDAVAPLGKVYLPDASYREMTEWVLPTERLLEYQQVRHELEGDPRWERIKPFVRGGFWRNFKRKYAEADEMYSRMMQVSRRLDETVSGSGETLEAARRELYRGQCNCAYWHGAFGGIYLPHLRNAVYNHLIAADNLLDQAMGRDANYVEATAGDFNFDAHQEVRLVNSKINLLASPSRGGSLYEFDVRSICLNLLSTMARRPEAYHAAVQHGPSEGGGDVASIHDRVVFKQEGLDELLQYDSYARKSMIDHFYAIESTPEQIARGEANECGDFATSPFEAQIRRAEGKVQLKLSRQGEAHGLPITITKGITVFADSPTIEIAYLLEGVPGDREIPFAVEFNFAGLPAGADDRYFYQGDREANRLGELGSLLNLSGASDLHLVDEWLGIDVGAEFSRPTEVWTFPVQTVSQSEGGFELVHQSVAVLPHWFVRGDADGRWSAVIRLTADTALAESRIHQDQPEAAAQCS